MYKIKSTSSGADLGMTEAPTYVRKTSNGCFAICPEPAKAQGIVFGGVVYNLLGCEPMEDVSETVALDEVDAGSEISALQQTSRQQVSMTSQTNAAAKLYVQATAVNIADTLALEMPDLFRTWDEVLADGSDLAENEIINDGGQLYRVVQDGTIEAGGTTYTVELVQDGQPYAISTHGFARDMVFSLVDQGEDYISLQLTDTPETRKVYPFSFSLTVTYTLERNRLKKCHRVENRSDKDMYYELGAHDGFRAPVEPGVPMSSWSIRLPGVERVQFYGMDESCTLTPKGEAIPLEDGKLPLTPSTYGLDTMVLDRPRQATAQLVDDRGHPRVSVEFPDFDYLGLWTADKPFDTGYVCIEPWSSLPDASFVGRELSQKAGVRRLAPGESEELSYLTTINHREKEEKG